MDLQSRLDSVFGNLVEGKTSTSNPITFNGECNSTRRQCIDGYSELFSYLKDSEDGEEQSAFKKPKNPAKKRRHQDYSRHAPDYERRPDKWTRYSLADTDMKNDAANARIAHDFLSSIKPKNPIESSNDNEKIVFQKRKSSPINSCGTITETSTRVIMPEYNFGSKPVKRVQSKKVIIEADDDEDGESLSDLSDLSELSEAES